MLAFVAREQVHESFSATEVILNKPIISTHTENINETKQAKPCGDVRVYIDTTQGEAKIVIINKYQSRQDRFLNWVAPKTPSMPPPMSVTDTLKKVDQHIYWKYTQTWLSQCLLMSC